MAEHPNEKVLNEIHMEFFIRLSRVRTPEDEHYRLLIRAKNDHHEFKQEFTRPEEYSIYNILERIGKTYDVYILAKNDKLAEGAREEILSLIALLIWKLNPK